MAAAAVQLVSGTASAPERTTLQLPWCWAGRIAGWVTYCSYPGVHTPVLKDKCFKRKWDEIKDKISGSGVTTCGPLPSSVNIKQ